MKRLTSYIRKLPPVVWFTIAVIYMEIVIKLFTSRTFFYIGRVFMPLFSLVAGLLLQALCSLFRPERQKRAAGIALSVLFVLFATQTIYQRFFNKFLIAFSLTAGGVGQVLSGEMAWNVLDAILKALPIVLLLAAPAVLCFIFYDRVVDTAQKRPKAYVPLLSAVALHAAVALVISCIPSVAATQSGLFDPNPSATAFGLLRTEVLDVKYNLLGIRQPLSLETENPDDVAVETVTPPAGEAEKHVSDIDFKALFESETDKTLKAINGYFAAKQPTAKNDYTGMYAGYNLVTVVAEGFSPYAIDETLTPTLYKMQQEGFRFNNFYTPIWGVSTSDGEYAVCTGLVPKAGVWSFYTSGSNYMPYCLGNMFGSNGVKNTFAYHNNTYTYYRRNISHANMGYTFKALGNGVEQYVQNVWPQSDLEMVQGSLTDYLHADEPFHAYYMTVSGHLEYTKEQNAMSAKNWDAVKDLDCSDTLKAYYACNIELDRAMEKLLAELEAAGVADKTVIAITPDHYPYGLEQDTGDRYAMWTELTGHEIETEFELYKSCFLLYCPSTENAPVIDKPCYSVDILPTLLNLFGFEYDSRLLMGSDILSDADGLVLMSNRSFITEYGKYNATTGEFTAFDESVFADEEKKAQYVKGMRTRVNNIFKISAKVLETDYYGYLFKE